MAACLVDARRSTSAQSSGWLRVPSREGCPRRTASAVVHVCRLGVFSPEADVFVGLRRILAPRESRRYEDTRSARNVAPSSANLVPGRGRAARRLTPFALCVSAAAVASACSADGSQPRWPAIGAFTSRSRSRSRGERRREEFETHSVAPDGAWSTQCVTLTSWNCSWCPLTTRSRISPSPAT